MFTEHSSLPSTHPGVADPDVRAVLDQLLTGLRAILGEQLVGLYLWGSLAMGDFDRHSDIDFIAATAGELSAEQLAALDALHARIAAGDAWCARELEGSYIPVAALRRYDPANDRHPYLYRWSPRRTREGPARLVVRAHDRDRAVQRHVLRERGLTLYGPPPATLIDPVSPADLRREMHHFLDTWLAPQAADPPPIPDRGHQTYLVLSVCRILYTLEHGAIVSKPVAARWAQGALGPRWAGLVARAWTGRQDARAPADPGEVEETWAFIRDALERSGHSRSRRNRR